MKIKNDYDLERKIKIADHGIHIEKSLLKQLKYKLGALGTMTGLDLMSLTQTEVAWLMNVSASSIFYLTTVVADMIDEREVTRKDAEYDLEELTSKLRHIDVKTDPNLLKETEVVKTNYNLYLNEKHLPVLKEYKHVLMPTINEHGYVERKRMMQEHNLLSNEYVLSKKITFDPPPKTRYGI